MTIGFPGLGELTLRTKVENYYLMLVSGDDRLPHLADGRFALWPRHAGLKENEPLALSVGVNATRTLTIAATISAAIAGAAGSLYAHYIRIIDPDVFCSPIR